MEKTAMVAEVPHRPEARLAEILVQLGNTRAYTLIRAHGKTFRVHFEGDIRPSTIKQVDGQWVIIPDLI